VNVLKLDRLRKEIIGSLFRGSRVGCNTTVLSQAARLRYSAGRTVKELLRIFFCVRRERVRKISSLGLY
jgi:hypothetical protein